MTEIEKSRRLQNALHEFKRSWRKVAIWWIDHDFNDAIDDSSYPFNQSFDEMEIDVEKWVTEMSDSIDKICANEENKFKVQTDYADDLQIRFFERQETLGGYTRVQWSEMIEEEIVGNPSEDVIKFLQTEYKGV